jgi:hypothetical protein
LHPLQKTLSLSWDKKNTLWGNFETFISIVKHEDRDIDFTLSIHPQYFSFQFSLWFVAAGIFWSMHGTHLDCERDQGETAAIELLKRVLQEEKNSLELTKDITIYLQRKE